MQVNESFGVYTLAKKVTVLSSKMYKSYQEPGSTDTGCQNGSGWRQASLIWGVWHALRKAHWFHRLIPRLLHYMAWLVKKIESFRYSYFLNKNNERCTRHMTVEWHLKYSLHSKYSWKKLEANTNLRHFHFHVDGGII